MKRSLKEYIVIGLKGIAMGAADVVPGVSGGTIAFISGIYEELLESIDGISLNFFKVWKTGGFKKAWLSINGNFLLALFSGIAVSIVSFAKIIKWLLHNEALLLWSFFFGLVLASILYIGKQIQKWNIPVIITVIIGTVLSYLVTIAEPFASPESNWYLLFSGFLAIIAMILPGISGAFILLILGAYHTAINTVTDLFHSVISLDFDLFKEAFVKFLMLAIGAIVGIKAFSKVLNWMFKNHKNLTLAMLTGFMIGSLNKIWPWKEVLSWRTNSKGVEVPFLEKSVSPFTFQDDNQLLLAIVFSLIGFGLIFILERTAKTKA